MVHPKPIASLLVIGLIVFSSWAQAEIQRSVGVGFMSWPEQVDVTDSTKRSFPSTAQFYTPSFHYGHRDYRNRDGYLYEGYAFFGSADIESGGGLTYFQRRVPVYGFGGAVGWYFRPNSRQVNIGFSLPMQIRHAQWTDPPGGGEVSNKNLIAIGAVIDARWRLTRDFAINQRFGGFLGYKSALWMMNVEWTL
ncbi:MAG: hypothetical protein ACAH59_05590 [Pseudobdellovibrionaceae bacterium]